MSTIFPKLNPCLLSGTHTGLSLSMTAVYRPTELVDRTSSLFSVWYSGVGTIFIGSRRVTCNWCGVNDNTSGERGGDHLWNSGPQTLVCSYCACSTFHGPFVFSSSMRSKKIKGSGYDIGSFSDRFARRWKRLKTLSTFYCACVEDVI